MSAVSISGANLYQFFQSVSQTTTAPSVTPTLSTDGTDPSQQDTSGSTPIQGGHHHHHGGHGQFFQKIQSAVTSALQSAQDDPNADSNQTIQDAIESVLKGDSSDGSTSSTDSSSDGATTPQTASLDPGSSTPANSTQQFFSLLQSAGVDPQQFHQDFLSAIQQAQNGTVDPSAALQSLPPGSVVDTLA